MCKTETSTRPQRNMEINKYIYMQHLTYFLADNKPLLNANKNGLASKITVLTLQKSIDVIQHSELS